eukprot:TRINITY_DN75109_c0_g1_i1.p2 TRINITY_DN75109_c0_g1~~TRINITY_DN75109_c0_g1_i1.p2  ORF type:complete len:122 (-),score=5.13 TRINITY_DN75109_c0_g1_i1:195-560(-)
MQFRNRGSSKFRNFKICSNNGACILQSLDDSRTTFTHTQHQIKYSLSLLVHKVQICPFVDKLLYGINAAGIGEHQPHQWSSPYCCVVTGILKVCVRIDVCPSCYQFRNHFWITVDTRNMKY